MKTRMNYYQAAPDTIKALIAVEDQIKASGLELSLIELVKTRASQINGCAFCINMHTSDARKNGETEQRLYLLNAWRKSPLYTDRERAALAWTEALTLIAETHAPDADYEAMRAQFSEAEAVNLTTLIGAINAWNRIAIGFRAIHPVKEGCGAHEPPPTVMPRFMRGIQYAGHRLRTQLAPRRTGSPGQAGRRRTAKTAPGLFLKPPSP